MVFISINEPVNLMEKMMNKPMPIQPTLGGRFIPNRIVEKLLETSTLDLNDIARMDFNHQERMQLAQLIGYSVSGFGTLSYVDDETYETVISLDSSPEKDQLQAGYDVLIDKFDEVKGHLAQTCSLVFEKHVDDFTQE